MKRAAIVATCIFIVCPTYSQDRKDEIINTVGRGRIYLVSGLIECENAIISKDSVKYLPARSNTATTVHLSQVDSIEEYVGDRSRVGGIVGAVAGGLGGLLFAISNAKEEQSRIGNQIVTKTTLEFWPFLVFGGGGGLIGSIIGGKSEKWDLAYKPEKP
jgi:hypothetical protein